jgi:hypothetical protein
MGLSWMLVGTRDARGPVSEDRFAAQWNDPVVGPEMRALGFERPEQLGALFVAGADDLRREVGTVPPLEDDFPYRLAPIRPVTVPRWYVPLGEADGARRRFEASPWVGRLWPAALRQRTSPWFEMQRRYDQMVLWSRANTWDDTHAVLTGTTLETLPLLLLGSDPDAQRAAAELAERGEEPAFVHRHRAARALSQRRFAEVEEEAAQALALEPRDAHLRALAAYALACDGRLDEARRLRLAAPVPLDPATTDFFTRTFGPGPTPR